jgi:hypothetical protein
VRRHETIPRAQGIENGLAARVHDPLWLLARQWQFGEFRHEDAASPAFVDLQAEAHVLDRWRPAQAAEWRPYDRAAEPLERLVEEEPTAAAGPRLRLEGGVRWQRLLAGAGLAGLLAPFVGRCPFPAAGPPVPPPAGGLAAALRARVPDGAPLAACLGRLADPAAAVAEADALELPAEARDAVTGLAADWLRWWAARAPAAAPTSGPHPAAWDEHRLEYAFELGASSLPDTSLRADGYAAGRLDWWAVDAVPGDEPAPPPDAPAPLTVRSVPAPARFGGMPAARFWEMEDARFDPGAIDAAPNDLGRLLLTTFATVYGNDWFVLPVRLPVASLLRVTTLAVTDVFGRRVELSPAGVADDGWNLFGLTDPARGRAPGGERVTSPWFFLAPALAASLESPPVETVLFLRDEMANLAWAVEVVVSDAADGLVDRFGAPATRPPVPPRAEGAPPVYVVDTAVPDNWYPLAAEPLPDRESVRLRLAPLARVVDGQVTTTLPIGVLLAGARGGAEALWVHEEEVPRSGVVVARTNQRARGPDGSVHVWTARAKGTGGGEGSSGLRFDLVQD